jgi:hypothetical protein
MNSLFVKYGIIATARLLNARRSALYTHSACREGGTD